MPTWISLNFFASDFGQLSADSKIKAQNNKTEINFIIFILLFVEICLQYDTKYDFDFYISKLYGSGSALAQ